MTSTMAWFLLFMAGIMEISWTIGLKFSQGFTRPLPSILTVAALAASMLLLGQSIKVLPLGTAYAIWVGIGALGAAVAGIVLFQEAVTPTRIFFLLMLLISIMGLKWSAA